VSGKSPAFQFYAAEYLADENVQLMTLEEEGCYIRMLAYCWREGSIPAEHKLLSRLCKNASEEVLTSVERRFEKHGTRLEHARLNVERKKQKKFNKKQRLAGIASGKARRKKKLSIEPSFNQRSSSVGTKTNSSSSSSSAGSLPSGMFGGNGASSAFTKESKPYPTLPASREGNGLTEYSLEVYGELVVIRKPSTRRLWTQREKDGMQGKRAADYAEFFRGKGFESWVEVRAGR
jgi:uncharacterized protein YdaU (DUF1376 family)